MVDALPLSFSSARQVCSLFKSGREQCTWLDTGSVTEALQFDDIALVAMGASCHNGERGSFLVLIMFDDGPADPNNGYCCCCCCIWRASLRIPSRIWLMIP